MPVDGTARVLVVEDDGALNEMLVEELAAEGWQIESSRSAEGGFELAARCRPDLVVTDLQLPGSDGMQLLESLLRLPRPPAVLMITAFGTVERAVAALKAGADNFLTKPLDIEHFLIACRRLVEQRRIRDELDEYRNTTAGGGFHGMIGSSRAMLNLFDQVRRIAPTDASVLVVGPSGSGKEHVARALHAESRRADAAFIAVNCAAVPADLMESEFFGYASGAFTGADRERPGLFREASGGTLFLDEISEMSLALQARLLRALQDGRIRPLGVEQEVQVDVRIVAASNRDLGECVRTGEFREDLYYRLETFQLEVPALAERGADIELLAQRFLLEHARAHDRPATRLGDDALERLRSYDWPGNVRELGNAIERAVTFCNGEVVGADDLPTRIRLGAAGHSSVCGTDDEEPIPMELLEGNVLPTLEELRKRYVNHVLKFTGGNKRRAAALLGVGRRTLYRWLDAERHEDS
ncbi:sigma-54-dependent Fis family transcriptional regulator [Wenzhouxiangella sp. XN79A]|nr:sigma-54-dependent Fis family transcriptional regulator [Wenzhouxiangella sp. XN79A]